MTVNTYKEITSKLRKIIKDTKWENHLFTVGGCNRDMIMGGFKIKDVDLVCDLPNGGIEFAKWLEDNNYTTSSVVTYENFGTAMFHLKAFPDIELEVVHTRKECYHDAKSRNPETSYGTLKEDWTRRDFTINAIYYDISNDLIIDFENRGVNDINEGIIRTCGDPEIIYKEDPLRILRMVRFASRYDFKIEDNTFKCAKNFVERLEIISKERITDEFTRMMTYNNTSAQKSLCLLYDLGAFQFIIPELHECGVYTLFSVTEELKLIYKSDIVLILTKLLFHCNNTSFKNKSEYIKYILQKTLIYSNDVVNEVIFLTDMNEKLYKLCTDISVSLYEHSYEVRRIMNLCGSKERFYNATICGSKRVYYEFQIAWDMSTPSLFEEFDEEDSMFYTYKLPIDGNDVMEVFNIEPSKKVKKILDKVFTFVLINTDKTSKEDCMNYLKYLKKTEDEFGDF